MNDPTADVGIARNPGGGPARPIKGAALPLVGWSAFLEHKWNDRWSSTAGYSLLDIGNTEGQSPSAFNRGPYALGNLLYTPAPNVMVGGELNTAVARTSRMASARTTSASSSLSNTTSRFQWAGSDRKWHERHMEEHVRIMTG
jgi:hypothetical protein